MKLGFDRKALGVAALLVLGVCTLIVSSLQALSQLRASVAELDEAHEVQLQTQRLHIALLELEAARQRCLAGPQPEPCRAALAKLDAELHRLSALASEHPEQAVDLSLLRPLVEARRREQARIIALADPKQLPAARALEAGDADRAWMDEIRPVLARLDATESASQEARHAARAASIDRSRRNTLLLAGVVALLVLVLATLVRRDKALRARLWSADEAARIELEHRVAHRTGDLQAAMDELALGKARMRAIFDTASDAILTVNAAQCIVEANAAAGRLFGHAVADLVGKPLDELVPARYREAHRRDVDAYGAGEEGTRRMGRAREVMAVRAGGQEFPIEAGISHFDVNGQRLYTVILRDVSQRRQAEAELARSNAELQRLIENQHQGQEDERKRIARELHDDLQQSLAAIRMDAVAVGERLAQGLGGAQPLLQRIDQLSAAAIASTRRIVSDLRPELLEDLGLVPALQALCEQHAALTGARCRLQVLPGAADAQIDHPAVATGLYRIAQEALNNVAKHAGAAQVDVHLTRTEGGLAILRVSDDGVGMDPRAQRPARTFGLKGMTERVRALGGQLRIDAAPGRGTTLEVLLPVLGAAPGTADALSWRARDDAADDGWGQPLQGVIDALAGSVAVLDRHGQIRCVNRAWREHAARHGDAGLVGGDPGVNYVDVCRRSDPSPAPVLQGLDDVLAGRREAFIADYACDTAAGRRWFRLHAAAVAGGLVIVTHVDRTDRVDAGDAAAAAASQRVPASERQGA